MQTLRYLSPASVASRWVELNIILMSQKLLQELISRWDRPTERELLRSAPRKLPEFAEITQNNGHYAVQGHSRSPILVPIESLYTISY